jgi:hypothetical protein
MVEFCANITDYRDPRFRISSEYGDGDIENVHHN